MSAAPDNGGPAFPVAADFATFSPKNVEEMRRLMSGLSLRDYFASKAMQGICSHIDTWGITTPEIAAMSYAMADEMLKARAA